MQRAARKSFKSKELLFIVLFCCLLSGPIYASSWNGREQHDLWSDVSNWTGGIPGSSDNASWNLSGTTPCHLKHDAGSIQTLLVGEYAEGSLIILDGGSVTASNFITIMNRSGNIDIYPGGQLNSQGDLIIGQWDDIAGDEMILNMYGGTVNVAGTLRFGFYFDDSNVRTHAQLDGGQLFANSISGMQEDRGTIDITEGQLIINGNRLDNVNSWVLNGFLTAYDGDGEIVCDYDQTHAGQTTISATGPLAGDTDDDKDVDIDDLLTFAEQWMADECGLAADFNDDCLVNLTDMSMMSANWLYGVSFLAHSPSPNDGQFVVPTTLSWDSFSEIESYDIYFGTNYQSLLNADHSSPEYQGNQTEKTFEIGALIPYQIYYWRIDGTLGVNVHKGSVWSFTADDQENTVGYIGATCGFQYSAQLEGPVTYPDKTNISLYNPQPGNPTATWEDWAAQIHQAGLDFVCPNLTGSWPNTSSSPRDMAPLVAALNNLGNVTKFGLFDDNAASWCAQWNMANGRGYWYEQPFDISDPANWVFLYEYNYKLFFETVPDSQLFKINGRPVLWIWTANPYFIANSEGNLSQAMLHVRQRCLEDFGYDLFIVGNRDFITHDSTCANPGVLDATHSWFGPPNDPYTLSIHNGVKSGVAVPQFQNPYVENPSSFLDPEHGLMLDNGLNETVGAGALMTLLEGFTDYEEDAAFFRVRNIDENGNPLAYEQTFYDYPNQRLNIIRKHTSRPFPSVLRLEAEGCDTFGGAVGGGIPQLYRNGNIAIEPTQDIGGGFNIGWIEPGQWLQWQEVPMEGKGLLQVRAATNSDHCRIHFEVDGHVKPTVTLPNTGGFQSWMTVDTPVEIFAPNSYHTVRLVCETSGLNINWIQFVRGGQNNTPPEVWLTGPDNNTTYSEPAMITLEANAFDSDGSVTQVDFYQGSTLLGTDHTAPYSYTWNNAPAGNHRLIAKAVDDDGAVSTSQPAFVQVDYVSLNKPAYASSVAQGNVASNAVDDSLFTRWESAYSDPQWIYVDLQGIYDISKVVIRWENAYSKSYHIQVSNNASSWTTVYSNTNCQGGYESIDLTASGRYVRMYGVQRATGWGHSLYDFRVYGDF